MTFFKTSLFAALFTSSAFFMHSATAAENFGKAYQPVAPVGQTQAQIVYYRDASNTAGGAAHVYVDNEFHDALLPEGIPFSAWHLASIIWARTRMMRRNIAVKSRAYNVEMSGGQTYFVRVNHTMNAVPEARTREQAERSRWSARTDPRAVPRLQRRSL
jgi:OOP family OmpA-OmpF porin